MKPVLCLFVLSLAALGQESVTPPPLADIVSRITVMNEARMAALRQYHGTRVYRVSYKGFPKDLSAEAVVRLDYTAPDNKQFEIVSKEGSNLLINRVIKKALESEQEAAKPEFRKRSALNQANYEFKFVRTDTEDGRRCYVLQVTPRRSDKYLYEGQIWVDAADYAVARIDAKPAKNPSFWINRAHIDSHSEKNGEFWFPASTVSTSHVRFGGNAVLSIDYNDYEVTDASRPNPTLSKTTSVSSAGKP